MSRIIGDTILMNRMAEITGKSLPSFSLPPASDSLLDPIVITNKAHSESDVFSPLSYLNPEIKIDNSVTVNPVPVTDSWQVSLFIMLVLGYYLFVIYRYMPLFSTVFRISFSLKKTLTLYEIQNNEQSGLGFHCFILNIVLMSVFAYNLIPTMEIVFPPFAIIGVSMLAILAMQFYKWVVLKICDKMSDSGDVFIYLAQIRSHSFILTSIIGIPIAVIASTYPGDNYIVILSLIVLWLYAIIRILTLFIHSGFGGLRWILYLCTVELLPMSYLVAIAQRL